MKNVVELMQFWKDEMRRKQDSGSSQNYSQPPSSSYSSAPSAYQNSLPAPSGGNYGVSNYDDLEPHQQYAFQTVDFVNQLQLKLGGSASGHNSYSNGSNGTNYSGHNSSGLNGNGKTPAQSREEIESAFRVKQEETRQEMRAEGCAEEYINRHLKEVWDSVIKEMDFDTWWPKD